MDKRKNRMTISYLLAILLTIFISTLIITTVTRFTIMSPQYILKKMDQVNFYQETVNELNDQIQQETQSTGFPLEMFENYLDKDSCDSLIKNYFEEAFKTGNTTLDTSEFENKLSNDINEYLESANIIINSEEQQAIATLKENLIDYYKTYLSFPYLSLIINIINSYNSYYPIIAGILLLLILITSIILYRLYSHYRGRRRYFSYAISSSGLICFALPAVILIGKYIDKISLSPKYFYDLVTTTINNFLFIYVVIGIILVILGTLIAFIKFEKHN